MTCSPRIPALTLKEKSIDGKIANIDKDLLCALSPEVQSPLSLKSILKSSLKCETSTAHTDIPAAKCDETIKLSNIQSDQSGVRSKNKGIRLTVHGEVCIELLGQETDSYTRQGASGIRITSDKEVAINISGNGDSDSNGIHIHSQGAIDLSLGSIGKCEQDHKTTTNEEYVDKDALDDEETDYEQSLKGHRRNNSAHLMVVGPGGKGEFLTGCEKNLDMFSNAYTDKDLSNEKGKRVIDSKTIADAKKMDQTKEELLTENTTLKTSIDNTNNTHSEIDGVCTKFNHLGKNSMSAKHYASDRINLSDSIKSKFTLLLRDIRLVPLCDHLYQNDVIDMDTYQSLYEGTKHGHMTQMDGVRQLLMHLSCVSIKQGPFRKSLWESNHEDIIPLLLPT